jgi:hypothetical protein
MPLVNNADAQVETLNVSQLANHAFSRNRQQRVIGGHLRLRVTGEL